MDQSIQVKTLKTKKSEGKFILNTSHHGKKDEIQWKQKFKFPKFQPTGQGDDSTFTSFQPHLLGVTAMAIKEKPAQEDCRQPVSTTINY